MSWFLAVRYRCNRSPLGWKAIAPKIDRPYGGISRESLRRLARGKTVRVETSAIDSRGLLVGSVLIIPSAKECGNTSCEERVDPGLAQLTSGLAWIDKTNLAYQSAEARARYAVAEAHAKANKLGLWRQPPPQIRAAVR